ncbi:MAG: ABC transporter ATP-binding protein, partial [Candidatus Micrarchaeaceae archaeon]
SVLVLGEDPFANDRLRASLGFVGENYSLYDKLTVIDNIRFFSGMYGIGLEDARKAARELLYELGAGEFLERRVGELSRGTKQKVAICRSLIADPSIMVLDEPTAFLDPSSAESLRELLYKANKKGKTIVYATQRLDELSRLNGEIALLNNGMLVAKGSLAQVMREIKGVEVEVVLSRKPSTSDSARLMKLGAKIFGRRLLFRIKNLSELPEISESIGSMHIGVLTITYVDYNLQARCTGD